MSEWAWGRESLGFTEIERRLKSLPLAAIACGLCGKSCRWGGAVARCTEGRRLRNRVCGWAKDPKFCQGFIAADRKIVGDTHHITQKRGNGQLRREIWVDAQGQVTCYNLAYINHALHGADNGRVVGYDNQHGHHHRHYFGVVAAVEFTSFDNIEDQFQTDWTALRSTV